MTVLQMALFASDLKTEWVPPAELPDIFDAKTIAIDVETRDPNLMTRGPVRTVRLLAMPSPWTAGLVTFPLTTLAAVT